MTDFLLFERLKSITYNRVDANKSVLFFQMLINISFLQNSGSNSLISLYSSHFTHKTAKERHNAHTAYVDTDVLLTLFVDSVIWSGLTKVIIILTPPDKGVI